MKRLLVALALVGALDVASTAYSLAHGHSEGNPLIAVVLADTGLAGFVVLKVAAWGCIAYVARTWPGRLMTVTLAGGIAVTAFFAALNFAQ